MNESLCVKVVKQVTLNCCNEDKKCEVCKPVWQRTLILSESGDGILKNYSLWFPVHGMTNDTLKKMAKSKNGLLIDHQSGVWYADEDMALSVAVNDTERKIINEISAMVKDAYDKEIEKKDGAACEEEKQS
jgi:hypothetical protein